MLNECLEKGRKLYPERIAIVQGDKKISYGELWSLSRTIASNLDTFGVGAGDTLLVLLDNSIEFVATLFGSAAAKAIFMPINPALNQQEVMTIIAECQPKIIISEARHQEILLSSEWLNIDMPKLIVTGEAASEQVLTYDQLLKENGEETPEGDPWSGPFLRQLSSGTTGYPKQLLRSQSNLQAELTNFGETLNVTGEDRILCVIPLFHAHGLANCLLAAIGNGATLILENIDRDRKAPVPLIFRRKNILNLMRAENVTIFPGVPYLFEGLVDAGNAMGAKFNQLRLCFSAGEALRRNIAEQFETVFGVPLRQLYGCTEAGAITIGRCDENGRLMHTNAGFPFKNVNLEIREDDNRVLDNEMTGDVWIRGDTLCAGYVGMEDLNRALFVDGWYSTGDRGFLGKDGALNITGRKADFISVAGYKVDPKEIETVLLQHSDIREVIVVGIQVSDGTAKIRACIVGNEGAVLHRETLTKFCKQRLTAYKVPREFCMFTAFPRTTSGKIIRQDLLDKELSHL